VFRAAAPVAAVGFLISWLLPEVRLRKTVAASDPGQTFGMPTDRTSLQELERAVGVVAQGEDGVALYRRIAARAGLDGIWPGACCLLSRLAKQSEVTLTELAVQIRTPTSNLGPILSQLTSRGLVSMPGGGEENIAPLTLTERGQAALERLRAARRDDLAELLEGWSPFRHPELAARLRILARELIDQDAEKLHQFTGPRTSGSPRGDRHAQQGLNTW
jgi:DNA-binding MarR family transcriptional regulator